MARTFDKIGIIGAMSVEVDGLKKLMENVSTETVSGVKFYSGVISDKNVVVAECGVGKVFAAICAEAMIIKFGVDALINTGVAGNVSDLKIKDIVIAKKVVQYDMDSSALGDPVGMISGINKIYFEADETLITVAKKTAATLGYEAFYGVVATGDKFVADKDFKNYLNSSFGASCAEMEGGSIGHVAYVNNVPFAVIRAISDGDGAAMDFNKFCNVAAERSVNLIAGMLKNL